MMIALATLLPDTLKTMTQPQEKVVGEDIYIVMIVTMIVWGGIFFYLMYLDRKVKNLEKRIEMDEETV
ncbi:MAG: CcmD family protein [Calditrichia bacterium]